MQRRFFQLFLMICLLFLSGCDMERNHLDPFSDNPAVVDTITLPPLDESKVGWVTMTGGLGGITTKVLFNGNDASMIHKIVRMVNDNRDMLAIDRNIVDDILPHIRPIGLLISMENGEQICIWPSYEKVSYSGGSTVTTRSDCYTLQLEQEGATFLYTVFSSHMAQYLQEGWKEDMPVVDQLKITSDTAVDDSDMFLKIGDSITVSGDGCPNPTVNIFIRKNSNGEAFHWGTAKTVSGAWEWKNVIEQKFMTLDGREIQLDNGMYDVLVNFGEKEKAACGIIRIGELD